MPSTLGISKKIKKFEIGSRVVILPKGNFRNIPHPRYRGRVGTVIEKRGESYVVEMRVRASVKSPKRSIIVPQIHLNRF